MTDGGPRPPLGAEAEATQRLPRRALHPREDFRRTVLLTILGAVVPGLGLVAARRRTLGYVIIGLFVAALLTVGIWALVDVKSLLSVAVRPRVLGPLSIALVVLAVAWVAVIIASHLSLRSPRPPRSQRVIGGVVVGVLAFAVAAPMAVAARYSYDQASLVATVFKSEKNTTSATRPTIGAPSNHAADPWADKPRLNVLLLGGDSGPDRIGTRTDTIILASIDTRTGDTTLFSVPRNTARMPFPSGSALARMYPNGFTNGNPDNQDWAANAIYDMVPKQVPPDILGKTDNLGADALKLSVGTALGLKVDYYALINLAGFRELINALGGITLNVNTYIPIGGNTDRHILPDDYIAPGPNQHLMGERALWYARGRYGADDFARMDRQRCVIDAIIKQANPANVLARYEAIAAAGKDIVRTDIPQEILPLMVDLSLRVKNGNVRSVVFKNAVNGFYSADPNFDLMRARVRAALGETTKPPKPPASPSSASPRPSRSATPSAGNSTSPASGSASDDLASSCAFQPQVAATQVRPPTR